MVVDYLGEDGMGGRKRMESASAGCGAVGASEANEKMLVAVAAGDVRSLRGAIELGAEAWLGCPQSVSDDPRVNPALAALLSPWGTRCMEEFDAFFGDTRRWVHGRWGCAHWAVATKNGEALAWALGGSRRGAGQAGLMQEEAESRGAPGGARRSALALAAQMGDPSWLARVIGAAELGGVGRAELARLDRGSSVSALGLAMFELANGARQGGSEKELAGRVACAETLFELGFPVDGSKAAGAKLCVALALRSLEGREPNRAMSKAARRAVEMGSGAREGLAPAGGYEAAGLALDVEWARALSLCGMSEPGDGSFALGASKRMLLDLRAPRCSEGWEWARGPRAAAILARMGKSLAAAPVALAESPLGGGELEVGRWMVAASLAGAGAGAGSERFREGVELAIASAEASVGGSPRRALRV